MSCQERLKDYFVAKGGWSGKLMYGNGRIIIDTRKYDVEEVLERYKRGGLIFYEKNNIKRTYKNKVTLGVLEALSRGIPFPPVYVSEMQTGKMLVLEKGDRLRFLMEYFAFGVERNSKEYLEFEEMYHVKDIFYSPIIFHVIDYVNPKYMHMQVGAFIEEWSAIQEQRVRNMIYQKETVQVWGKLSAKIHYSPRFELNIQYSLIYFFMVSFIIFRHFDDLECQNADKFQLLEKTLSELRYKDDIFRGELCEQFEEFYCVINQKEYRNRLFMGVSLENKTKYLCFMGVWMKIRSEHYLEMFENKRISNMIIECDMGYRGISRILEEFRGAYL